MPLSPKAGAHVSDLSPERAIEFEQAVVVLFSDLADLFGNPRSHGAIYGLLFAQEKPLSMEDIVVRLGISKGSASQGLRQLEQLGAIIRDRHPGSRTGDYAAKLELKPLLSGFLVQRLMPRLEATRQQLQGLDQLLDGFPADAAARARLKRLAKWHKRASSILPLLSRLMLGG